MVTYQDFLKAEKKGEFILDAVTRHRVSAAFRTACDAEEYDAHRNVTITRLRKVLRTVTGSVIPDNISANYRLSSNFFHRFVVQQVQYLLGNGIVLRDSASRKKLGTDFDARLSEAAYKSLLGGVSFGFWNLDHLSVFSLTEFVPLYDEETGALMAGIRFWQLDGNKPLRMTLFESDGYTEYICKKDIPEIYREKRKYKLSYKSSRAFGKELTGGENYSALPIVPLKGNIHGQSELVGLRENIDCYDLIKSGFANDLDDASQIYWILTNTGGMDDVGLAEFIQRLKTVKAAVVDGDSGVTAEAHTLEVPYESRTAYLERLRRDLYEDYQALDVSLISSASVTATQIEAAYEPLNEKADMFEYCILDFLGKLFEIAGIEGEEPSFVRSQMSDRAAVTQMIISAAQFLDEETIIRKLPFLTPEEAAAIIEKKRKEENEKADGQSGDDSDG